MCACVAMHKVKVEGTVCVCPLQYKASLIWDTAAGPDQDSQPSPRTQILAPDSDPEEEV